ncbi:MAG: DUF362 domain-containing protein [Nitrospirae bacterium]|nr:DUF362 domain-containing protein [Nitrospirota bacterium]MBI5696349.1 DUF362 domain-containing protein [Nitrospirota bacterium]
MSTVYYTTMRGTRWDYRESVNGRLERMLAGSGLMGRYAKDEWVAVKTHFGSDGAHRVVRPNFLKRVVDAVRMSGAKPFVTDTVRIMGLDYLEVANGNGINHLSVGAPVVLADGLYGKDNILVKAGEILGEIAVASLIHDVPAMVVVSHIKGHIQAGYAGAIKNLAMGGVSSAHREHGWKKGRGKMHCYGEVPLQWDAEVCTFCAQCENVCPKEAVAFKDEKFAYNEKECWACGRCARVCPSGALVLPADDTTFQKSLAEASAAVLSTFKPGKVLYLNFMTEIQPECDCMPSCDTPMLQDQGIMLSDDVVAIEKATIDMLRKASPLPQSVASDRECAPGDDVLSIVNPRNFMLQVEHAEALGLGSQEYELVEV